MIDQSARNFSGTIINPAIALLNDSWSAGEKMQSYFYCMDIRKKAIKINRCRLLNHYMNEEWVISIPLGIIQSVEINTYALKFNQMGIYQLPVKLNCTMKLKSTIKIYIFFEKLVSIQSLYQILMDKGLYVIKT